MYIPLGHKDAPMNALELVRIYKLDLEVVNADIDAVVQSERHKARGVFEIRNKSDP